MPLPLLKTGGKRVLLKVLPEVFDTYGEDYTVDMVTMLMFLPRMISQPRIELHAMSPHGVHLLRAYKMTCSRRVGKAIV